MRVFEKARPANSAAVAIRLRIASESRSVARGGKTSRLSLAARTAKLVDTGWAVTFELAPRECYTPPWGGSPDAGGRPGGRGVRDLGRARVLQGTRHRRAPASQYVVMQLRQVIVTVDHPGHHRHAGGVEHLGPGRHGNGGSRAHLPYLLAIHEHRHVQDRGRTGSVDQLTADYRLHLSSFKRALRSEPFPYAPEVPVGTTRAEALNFSVTLICPVPPCGSGRQHFNAAPGQRTTPSAARSHRPAITPPPP